MKDQRTKVESLVVMEREVTYDTYASVSLETCKFMIENFDITIKAKVVPFFDYPAPHHLPHCTTME